VSEIDDIRQRQTITPPRQISRAAADELLAELTGLLETHLEESDALTSGEIQQALGISYERTLRLLHELKRAGKIESVRVGRENLSGALMFIPAYRLRRG